MNDFAGTPRMRTVAACIRADVPLLVTGSPGIAKSATLADAGTQWGFDVQTILGSIRDTTDFLGLPFDVDGQTHYAPPAWAVRANQADKSLVIFDEFRTMRSTMKAMLRVLQERWVGDLALRDSVRIVAIANSADDSVDGVDLDPPIANRFCHLEWQFDLLGWLDGLVNGFTGAHPGLEALAPGDAATRARVMGVVQSYLKANPSQAAPGVPGDERLASGAWASPRSWTNLVDVLGRIHPHDVAARTLVVNGLVGEGSGTAFLAYLASMDLVDPAQALADPTGVDWTARPDLIYALVMGMLTLTVADGGPSAWESCMAAFVACADAGRPDVPIPGVISLMNRMPDGARLSTRAHEHVLQVHQGDPRRPARCLTGTSRSAAPASARLRMVPGMNEPNDPTQRRLAQLLDAIDTCEVTDYVRGPGAVPVALVGLGLLVVLVFSLVSGALS